MLKHVDIVNIAIIDSLGVSFEPGFSVITGESGSGKSLVLDAISLVLGKGPSPKTLLRHGAERGRVELVFDLPAGHAAHQILNQHELSLPDNESELLLSREFTASGSRYRVQGMVVSQDIISQLGSVLLEIYGQHDLHTLFSSARQRDLVDAVGGEPVAHLKKELKTVYRQWQKAMSDLAEIDTRRAERERELDFLNFQITELESANLSDPEEDSQLQAERDRLSQRETLIKWSSEARAILDGEDYEGAASLDKLLGQLERKLSHIQQADPTADCGGETFDSILVLAGELKHQLSTYQAKIDTHPERLDEVMERLDQLEKLKRKYGPQLAEVFSTFEKLCQQRDELLNQSEASENLGAEIATLAKRYQELACALTEMRTKLAGHLTTGVQQELASLLLENARFDITVSRLSQPGESGQDDLQFQFSANPGDPLKPLAQVASGGEMSRLMLALKLQTFQAAPGQSLILDEIDTGLSGLAVRAMADKLGALGQSVQIIAVTHQPILAAKAKAHGHIDKITHSDRVEVSFTALHTPETRKAVLQQLALGSSNPNDPIASQFAEQLLNH